jgi:methionyl-tRNA formyltransferase
MTGRPAASLRVVFLGTPAFALPSLRALASDTTLVLVVTQPDRPAGRGRRLTAPPVAAAARELGLRLIQPASLRSPAVQAEIAALRPDLLVVVAYGRIIPPGVLTIPPVGGINLHPSLLPAYRGASPIQAAIADGARTTGVTVMHLASELDAGDIILQREIAIDPEETAGELEARLAADGAALLRQAVERLARGDAPRIPQDHSRATYVGKVTKADGEIRWTRPAQDLVNHVRAMNPWPCAFTGWREGILKIWKAQATDERGVPGTLLRADAQGIVIATGAGALVLLEVQPEAGRRMSAAEFVRGRRLDRAERFGANATPPADDEK